MPRNTAAICMQIVAVTWSENVLYHSLLGLSLFCGSAILVRKTGKRLPIGNVNNGNVLCLNT